MKSYACIRRSLSEQTLGEGRELAEGRNELVTLVGHQAGSVAREHYLRHVNPIRKPHR
jgi:hypothetical protein